MKTKTITLIGWGALATLLLTAASLPRYVGRFFGDGAGISNAPAVWTNSSKYIWPNGEPVPTTGTVPGPSHFFTTNGSHFIGPNVGQDSALTGRNPFYAVSMWRSNEPTTIQAYLAVLDSESYSSFATMDWTIFNRGDAADSAVTLQSNTTNANEKTAVALTAQANFDEALAVRTNNVLSFKISTGGQVTANSYAAFAGAGVGQTVNITVVTNGANTATLHFTAGLLTSVTAP